MNNTAQVPEQSINGLRNALAMCQKANAELESQNATNEEDLKDMGNQVIELEEVIDAMEKERDEFQAQLAICQEKLKLNGFHEESSKDTEFEATLNKLKDRSVLQENELKSQQISIDELRKGH